LSPRAEATPGSAPPKNFRGLELWCADLRTVGPALREAERRTPRLSDWERQNARAFADAALGAEWLAAQVMVRLLLERAVGAEWRTAPFVRSAHGKPHLEGAPVAFSLSHVPGLALIGVGTRGPIGVDVERARPVRVRAPRRNRILEAGAALNVAQALPAGEDARFLQAWVRLEAFAKAQGCGIGRLLTRLGIVGDRAVARDDLAARIGAVRVEAQGATPYDLSLGAGLFAAAALGPAQTVPEVCWLPASIDGLGALLT